MTKSFHMCEKISLNNNNNNTYIAPISILLFSSALKNKNIKKIKIKIK